MFFPYGKKHRNIFFCNDVAFAEYRIFCHTFDNLCNIVAEHLAYRVFCFHQFHLKRLTFSI